MRTTRVPLVIAASIITAFSLGCLDKQFLRDNPLDTGSEVDAMILGVPDTAFSLGDTFRVSLVTDRELPPGTVIRWYGFNIQSLGGGLFRTNWGGHPGIWADIVAELGPTREPRQFQTRLNVRQRVYQVDSECDTGCLYRWLEWNDTVLTTPRDSVGFTVAGYEPAPDVTVVSRDTNVASVPAARTSNYWTIVRPRGNGQTWIVMFFGSKEKLVSDSFPVTVQQLLWSMTNNCPMTMEPSEGDTVRQIVATLPGTDLNGIPFAGVMPALQWVLTGSSGNDLELTVSTSGLVQYVSGSGVASIELQAEGGRTISECTIHVPWPASVLTAPTP